MVNICSLKLILALVVLTFMRMVLVWTFSHLSESIIGQYEDDILMLMYDDVVIRKKSELVNDNFSLI